MSNEQKETNAAYRVHLDGAFPNYPHEPDTPIHPGLFGYYYIEYVKGTADHVVIHMNKNYSDAWGVITPKNFIYAHAKGIILSLPEQSENIEADLRISWLGTEYRPEPSASGSEIGGSTIEGVVEAGDKTGNG